LPNRRKGRNNLARNADTEKIAQSKKSKERKKIPLDVNKCVPNAEDELLKETPKSTYLD